MRKLIPFNESWLFTKPGENRVPVTLPHTWNNLDGQDGGGDYWRGECVSEKTFAAPDRKANEEVYLEFDGVSASAHGDDLFYQDEMTDQVISFLNRLSGKGE